MNKKVRIYNPQYAKGGITQQDIQNYLMAQQQQQQPQQPQITEDTLVDTIYNELSVLGDEAGYVDEGYLSDIADKLTQAYGIDNDYVLNLVNEVYSTLAPSDLQYQNSKIAQGSPVPKLDMNAEQSEYQEDVTEENLEENVATYDDYYGDDTGMSEMKFGGMTRKNFMKDFIRKAQEGMEQESDESIMGNNDILDGRNALVKGFESSVKKAVVKAVAKNQFDKMKQQNSYFSEGGFYDPNNLGDDEAYAHHLNLMAQAGKDIFNQPQMTMARDGREQRRASRDQRRVGRDVQRALNDLPGLYPGGFNVYSMPGQMMPNMSQMGQGMPPFTIEGERNIFGGLKNYKASFEGGLPVNFMAGMMMPQRGRRTAGVLSSMYGYPESFYSQQSYSNPGKIVYEEINKETLKEVDKNTPNNSSTEVKEEVEGTTPVVTPTATTPAPRPVVNPNIRNPVGPKVVPNPQPIVPPYTPSTTVNRNLFPDYLEDAESLGKNYKEWQTKEGGRAVSYEAEYTTGMFGTKHPARYQIVYKPDGSIDKKKSFVAVSQGDYGGTIYVPWDKQGTLMYNNGGAVMNSNANPFGELQKYVYGGYDPSVAELDGTNLVDPSDPYTRKFAGGGTQEEYQQYIDWYNQDAPEEGMRRAAPQSYEEWRAENYPETAKKQNIVPKYNPQNAALAAQYMSEAMNFNRTSPIQTLGRSVNPFSIDRRMVQKGMPVIAGTNIPFAGAIGPDARISEIYTDPRRFGKDATHIKFMVPGQEGPMLGMNWQQQVQQGQPNELDRRDMRRATMDTYDRSNVRGLEDESRVSVRAGERATKGDVRRGLRRDPNAFYEGEPQEGMTAPMTDEEYMAKVEANKVAAPNKPSTPNIKSDPNWDEKYKFPEGSDTEENKKIERERADKAWQMQGIKYDGVGTGPDHHVFADGTPAVYDKYSGRYEKATQRGKVASSTSSVPSKDNKLKDEKKREKDEKEKPESEYKSKRAALNAALNGIDRSQIRNLGPDYIRQVQLAKESDELGDVWKKMPKNTTEEMQTSNAFFNKELDPRLAENKKLRASTLDYLNNTSERDKRKNFRQFKKEARNRAEGGFVPDYMAYGGTPMYPDGGFVYNNPVDNRTNPVMSDNAFFTANTNNNSIPDYLEWQSTPNQEVDVTYQQKNKLNFQPQGLMPFLGSKARNTREMFDNNMIDQFNTQNMMTSNGREQYDELVSQGMYDINTGKEINAGFEGIVGAGKGAGQQAYSKFGGQLNYEEGGEYDLTEEEIQALIDAGVDITLLEDYED
jgi:hypothetical protein